MGDPEDIEVERGRPRTSEGVVESVDAAAAVVLSEELVLILSSVISY